MTDQEFEARLEQIKLNPALATELELRLISKLEEATKASETMLKGRILDRERILQAKRILDRW